MNEVITFGCRLNFYESELIKEALKKAERKNVVVVHSCAVTNEAERQVKQKIRKIYKNDPSKEIIVVGCAVQLDPEVYSSIPGVSKVLGNQDKLKAENYLLNDDKILVNDNQVEPVLINGFEDKSRAFIEIQNGCNHSCTFCSITEARGNNRSVPINSIIEQIRIFVENGYQEVVFTGVDITDFGTDLFAKPSLGSMIRRVLKDIPELKRLRLSSIDVAEVDNELMDLIANESRLMPHLHLSLQSGNNLILKRMKRRHNREQVIEFCHKMKSLRPNIVFGADIIAGFPTETDEMFQDTVDLLKKTNIVYLHAFPYSERKNTPAARMPQVPENVRKERVKNLREMNREMMSSFYQSLIGTEQSVLVEQNNVGRTENFALVKLESKAQAKSIVKVNVKGMGNNYLIGNILS
ncbi:MULTISPECIES: tRNA (N(6)-L-threonylcarbamoyladenosine(37)-C(2))-methylthiotransferase MtaB [Wolbachia]|uniref:tRNA (N(6)-L-threonylcarbamoyladenosine(37)-C(2))-methylthiotransferase n=1 Tax=Wolbachia pipientis TaxID=955 RepID=A0A7G5CCC9_WOLPI|nr:MULTISPECIES: tRNA (N(6)-L-threonylcarbamoyladenosine(37)-C(2))-methylthiotransferase MtaB [Wolbachia]MDE5060962.1 tRNA (N(6)-L-threonylcarbamoyladenosine(37)-C(2))-methylthiotransferase MtaB [Wolbachia endosymbiont of Drosophila nikananu]QMV46863.1 tRNA (N(6)-L-threonylcarbamoyladenosine(37)-C(2))-methylthiotransferase MtaB [Wolbachia pipientis]